MSKFPVSFFGHLVSIRVSQLGIGDVVLSGPQIYLLGTWTIASSCTVLIENCHLELQCGRQDLESVALV